MDVTTNRAFSTADFKISDLPGQKAGEAGALAEKRSCDLKALSLSQRRAANEPKPHSASDLLLLLRIAIRRPAPRSDIIEPLHALCRKPHPHTRQTRRNPRPRSRLARSVRFMRTEFHDFKRESEGPEGVDASEASVRLGRSDRTVKCPGVERLVAMVSIGASTASKPRGWRAMGWTSITDRAARRAERAGGDARRQSRRRVRRATK